MKTSEFMDKKVMDPTRSTEKDAAAAFNFFNPHDDGESDDGFDAAASYGFHLPNDASRPVLRTANSIDLISSAEVTREEAGITLFNQINQAIKENFDKVLRSVDGLGARLSQLDSKINHVENTVENLKVSAEYTNGKTDGKLRQLENMLREVQEGINFIKDKQEIAETQFQLAQLQVSKANRESQDTKAAVKVEPMQQSFSSVPEQPRPPLMVSSAVPSNSVHQQTTPTGASVAAQVHLPEPQNPLPMNPLPQSYNLPSGTPEPTYQQYNVPSATSGTTYQQYNVPPATSGTTPQQYNVPPATSETTYQHYRVPSETSGTTYQHYNVPPANSETSYKEYNVPPPQHPQVPPPISQGSYLHPSNLPQESQFTQAPHPHPPSGPFYSPDQSLWGQEKPHMSSHNYPQGVLRSSSLPPVQQFHTDSSAQQMRGQPSRSPYPEYPDGYSPTLQQSSFEHMLPYGGSSSNYRSSTMNPPQLTAHSSASSRSKHSQLPRARILPDALPTASIVEPGSSPRGSGNKNSVDEIVDKVAAMGFRRDQARATIKKLADDGQAVDLNVVLDKLMNS